MRVSSAISLCALLAAFLALTTAAESSEGEEGRMSWGTGCPNPFACIHSCVKSNYTIGFCLPLSNKCLCI
ncbi:hypothetical protein MTO96_048783 [Rhipicephalus appendiculatus]